MTGHVQLYPPRMAVSSESNRVRNAMPVLGHGQWAKYASMVNWLLGRGSTLVQAPGSGVEIDIWTSDVYRFYIYPHEQNFVRVWFVGIATRDNVATELFGDIQVSNGSAEWRLGPGIATDVPYMFEVWETIDPPTSTPGEETVTVSHHPDSDPAGMPYVTALSCYEVPRVALADFDGVIAPDMRTLRSGRQIYQDAAESKSLHSVAKAMHVAMTQARRSNLFSFYLQTGVVKTSTSFVGDILSGPVSVMPRHRYNGETSRAVMCSVYGAGSTSGGQGEVRLTTTTPPGSLTLTVEGTVPAWYHGTLAQNTEDPSRLSIDGGLRDGVRNSITVEVRRTTGGSVTFKGLCINEID